MERPEQGEADGKNAAEEEDSQGEQAPRHGARGRAASRLLEDAAKNVPKDIAEENKP
jgi:hypothetical protein